MDNANAFMLFSRFIFTSSSRICNYCRDLDVIDSNEGRDCSRAGAKLSSED